MHPYAFSLSVGSNAFKGKQYIRNVAKFGAKIICTESPYNPNTMQHREWQRGYNFYTKQLEKVKRDEARRRSQEVHAVAK